MATRQVWGACHCREAWRFDRDPVCPTCLSVWTPVLPPHVGERDAFDRLITTESLAGGRRDGSHFVRELDAARREDLLPLAQIIVELDDAGDSARLTDIANGDTPFWTAADGHIAVALARELIRLTSALGEGPTDRWAPA